MSVTPLIIHNRSTCQPLITAQAGIQCNRIHAHSTWAADNTARKPIPSAINWIITTLGIRQHPRRWTKALVPHDLWGPAHIFFHFSAIHRRWVVVHDYNNNGGYYYGLLTLKITASFPLTLSPDPSEKWDRCIVNTLLRKSLSLTRVYCSGFIGSLRSQLIMGNSSRLRTI